MTRTEIQYRNYKLLGESKKYFTNKIKAGKQGKMNKKKHGK